MLSLQAAVKTSLKALQYYKTVSVGVHGQVVVIFFLYIWYDDMQP